MKTAAVFRTELSSLPLPARIRRIEYDLAANRVALAARNEKLLALRGDFDALTIAFWKAFSRGLGCEDPEHTIADQEARMHSIPHLALIVLVIAATVTAVQSAQALPELAVVVGVAGGQSRSVSSSPCLTIKAPALGEWPQSSAKNRNHSG
jgi:hypothetical protein